jgi:hypothetical protein
MIIRDAITLFAMIGEHPDALLGFQEGRQWTSIYHARCLQREDAAGSQIYTFENFAMLALRQQLTLVLELDMPPECSLNCPLCTH